MRSTFVMVIASILQLGIQICWLSMEYTENYGWNNEMIDAVQLFKDDFHVQKERQIIFFLFLDLFSDFVC